MDQPIQQRQSTSLSVEQLFKSVQQHLQLWSKATGLSNIYPQASALAQKFDHAYRQQPGKWLAQLHQHKPHYDYVTNLTVKAMIFSALEVTERRWSSGCRYSIIGASLTANIAVIELLNRRFDNQPLSDKQRLKLDKATALSYRLLIKHHVLDPLWLSSVAASVPNEQRKSYPVGPHGAIIEHGYRLAKLLSNPNHINKISLIQALRQLYLDNPDYRMEALCTIAAKRIHRFGDGTLVRLSNQQQAIIIQSVTPIPAESTDTQPQDGFLVYRFTGTGEDIKGRLQVISASHIVGIESCINNDNPKLYSQLYEAPLSRFCQEKSIESQTIRITADDLFDAPPKLAALVSGLFEQPDLNHISRQIEQSPQLVRLLNTTASDAASQPVQITGVKHSLAMLGLNRVGPLMVQGALADKLYSHQFAGRKLVENRHATLIEAIKHYNQCNDLMAVEELTLYVNFWIAPWYQSVHLQSIAIKLNKRRPLDAKHSFDINNLFGVEISDQHRQHCEQLRQNWQLPQISKEMFDQMARAETDVTASKRVTYALAVIKLATVHCHQIFNLVDFRSAFLQQKLNTALKALRLSSADYQKLKADFVDQYAPYTPLE